MTNPYIKEAKVEVKNEFKDATINSGEKPGLNATSNQPNSGILGNLLPNFSSANFLQGAVVGAIAAYVLTNENTANEAIKFARVLQTNGAYIVKNALESARTHKDVIYNAPSNLYILEHSGLIVSINSSFSKNEENLYLEYDQKINSKEPINSMLNILR